MGQRGSRLRDPRIVRRVVSNGQAPVRESEWPATIPAVSQVLRERLELVGHWRRYLEEPMRYLRHVVDPDSSESFSSLHAGPGPPRESNMAT